MRIAIIGAGLAGLSAAWHLIDSCEVVLFDSKGIGGGASGIATGLMHPYAGEQGRRSLFAAEGVRVSLSLMETVEKKFKTKIIIQRGIIRHVQNKQQKEMFLSHVQTFNDVHYIEEDRFLIESGVTVDCPQYLKGLWQMIAEKGGKIVRAEIVDLQTLQDFDEIVITAGAGSIKIPEVNSLPISILKGQVLKCRFPENVECISSSMIGKGYMALTQEPRTALVGSTYERDYLNEEPDAGLAKELLFEKIAQFFPKVADLQIIDCKAALRVMRHGHYFPIIKKIQDRTWIMTAMGSRGLLYHVYLGNFLAKAILEKDDRSLCNLFNNAQLL